MIKLSIRPLISEKILNLLQLDRYFTLMENLSINYGLEYQFMNILCKILTLCECIKLKIEDRSKCVDSDNFGNRVF